jgi:glyoxylase-like metal-dependent hydrolase (beta-lactamase superfamily II)
LTRAVDASPAEWSPVPGTSGVELHSLINKPSLLTSNAFLLRTPFELIVIDPGASDEQKDKINQILMAELNDQARPVLIMLTHCHHDHSCHVGNIAPNAPFVRRLAHAVAIDAFRRQDFALTIASLYPTTKICDAHFDVALFSSDARSGSLFVDVSGETRLAVNPAAPVASASAERQTLRLSTGDELEFYHTPGHSPDHLCMRLGRLLFVGDLPFASNPGLAGLAGWDATGLAQSVADISRLIGKSDIEICHTGHGRSVPAATMLKILARVQQESSSLGDIAEIDKPRVAMLKAHALELLDVAGDLFAIIAGRMLSTARRLELLEEFEYAERFRTAIDADAIEGALDDLRRFCRNFRADALPELSTVLKCVQVMQRLEEALTAAGEVGGASLTGRSARLVSDFFNAVRGLRITNAVDTVDANELADNVIRTLRARPSLDAAEPPTASGEDGFRQSLAQRLAFVDILRNADVELVPLERHATTMADSERISDVLMDALELIAASGARHISIRTRRNENQLEIELRSPDVSPRSAIDERRQRVYRRVLAIGGSSLRDIDDQAIVLQLGPIEPSPIQSATSMNYSGKTTLIMSSS